MGQESYTDGKYKAFEASVPANLNGKEFYYVEMIGGTNKIQLQTNGVAVGVIYNQLEQSNFFNIRLLGCGGTYKVKTSGAIAHLAYVKGANGGTAVTQGGTGRITGLLISPAAGAASGDIVEVQDVLA
jgi:hypothetical protein